MHDPSLPNLAPLAKKLAASNQRVDSIMASLPATLDQLVQSTVSAEWPEVVRICQRLSQELPQRTILQLREDAQSLADAAHTGDSAGRKRLLLRLIGTVGRAQRMRGTSGRGVQQANSKSSSAASSDDLV